MSSTLRPQPAARPASGGHAAERLLRSRLAALRRRLRFVATFRGVAWLVACVLATAVLTGLVDFRVHLPGLVRAFVLTGLLTSAGLIVYRFLLQPLSTP